MERQQHIVRTLNAVQLILAKLGVAMILVDLTESKGSQVGANIGTPIYLVMFGLIAGLSGASLIALKRQKKTNK